MEKHNQVGPSVRFGPFELDVCSAELHYNGHTTLLHEQPFQVLLALLERPGELISREELVKRLWPDGTFVDYERGLNKAVNKLRDALGDSADKPQFIETLPRRGYRFIASVQKPGEDFSPVQVQVIDPGSTHSNHRHRIVRQLPIATVVVAVALLLAYLGWRQFDPPHAPPTARKIMLVVLPFENLSHDPEQEYFSDGMTEEMITQLGGLRPDRLGVIARVSSMKYKNTGKTIDQIGKELGVDYVLETSVRRSGDRVRITAQLIDVRDQAHVWAQSYDRDLLDVLAVQADVAHGIAEGIEIKLPIRAGLAPQRPVDREAYEDYLKGNYFLSKSSEEDWPKGLEYLKRAVAIDPTYARAYASLANFYFGVGGKGYEPFEQRIPKAESAARKAIALDDSLADGHISLASIYFYYYWDWPATEKEIKRGLDLNPSCEGCHTMYAVYLQLMGHLSESLAEYKRESELSPVNPMAQADVGGALYLMGRYDEAIGAYQKALELDRGRSFLHLDIAEVYEKKHMYPESIAEWKLGLSADDANLLERTYRASGFAEAKRALLRKQLETIKKLQEDDKWGVDLARCYARLGDKEQAFYWLERTYNHARYMPIQMKYDTDFDNLRSDPRFYALLRKAGVPIDSN